jgi:hypothetical protein
MTAQHERNRITMLKKDVLDAQVAVELPAREMLAFFNFSNVGVYQGNFSAQAGLLNISAGQINSAGVLVIQS